MWQNIKFTSFLCQRKIYTSSHLLKYQVVYFLCQGKNLHIKFITLLSVVNFLNKSTYLLIKFLIFVWNTIFPLPSQLRRRNKKIYVYTFINQEGLVMAKLKELRRSGNYMLWNSTWPWLCGGSFWNYFVVTLFNKSNACFELRDGDQAEFLSRRLEQYEHVHIVLLFSLGTPLDLHLIIWSSPAPVSISS